MALTLGVGDPPMVRDVSPPPDPSQLQGKSSPRGSHPKHRLPGFLDWFPGNAPSSQILEALTQPVQLELQ